MLAVAPLLAVLDSIAAGVDRLEDALGIFGDEPGTVSFAAASNRDVLAALDDASVHLDLARAFAVRAEMVRATSLYPVMQGGVIQRALDRHYGDAENGDLNTFLRNQDSRVHPNLNLIGMQIDSRNLFSPNVVEPVGAYEGTGAGTGTFTAGFDIVETQFGPAAMQVVVDVMGAVDRTIRLTMKLGGSLTADRDVVIPAFAFAGTTLDIGAAGERFMGVAGIVTVGGGGTAADRLHVRSTIERVIAL
jgi:hypothetical protein